MQRIRDHSTIELFDHFKTLGHNRAKRLKNSWAEVFRKHVMDNLPLTELASQFDPSFGRPTVDLPVVLGALILQQIFNLTDSETIECLAFNMAWHYALDIKSEADMEMTDRTLRNYRRLVIDLGLDDLIFKDVTDSLIKAFNIDTSRQRIDSTAFKSAMRELTRLGTFVETMNKFLRELKRKIPREYERVDPEITRKCLERGGEGCFGYRPVETRDRLPEAAKMLVELIDMFEGTEAGRIESYALMKRLGEEQLEIKGGGYRIKSPGEIPCDNMNNPSDPDSSYNRLKKRGYMAQVMETYSEEHGNKDKPDIITYVALNKMTEMDPQAMKPALDDVEKRGIMPESVIADTPYGASENVKDASRRNVKLISPAYPPQYYKDGMLSIEHFELEEAGLVKKCPAGCPPLSANNMGSKLDARFDPAKCRVCELRDICPCGIQVKAGRKPRLFYRHSRLVRRQRLLLEQGDEFTNRYRWRAGIEGTISRLKNWLKLGWLRVRGRPAVGFSLRLKAVGMNILRCAEYLS